jgi:hypothetical protein
MIPLFDNDSLPPSHELLEEGAVLLRGFATSEAPALVEEELGIPLPAGMAEHRIPSFPTPGNAIRKITSSPEKKRMLERLYAKYVYLCSFAHGLPQANLFKNMFDSRFPTRRLVRDSEVQNSYQHNVVGEAYITSFMSIAQCTAELTVLYPNNMDIIEAACSAWKQLSGASLITKAVWEIRTQKLLGAIS